MSYLDMKTDALSLAVLVRFRHNPSLWITYEPLATTHETDIVPEGFLTDLTSVPKVFRFFFKPYGEYTEAAIVHDYYYASGKSKKESDDKFDELLFAYGTKAWKRKILYTAVKWFGNPKSSRQDFKQRGFVHVEKMPCAIQQNNREAI